MADKKKKVSFLQRLGGLFSARVPEIDDRDGSVSGAANHVMGVTSADIEGIISSLASGQQPSSGATEEALTALPEDRQLRLIELDKMSKDGFVNQSISVMLNMALAPKTGGDERLLIRSSSEDPFEQSIVDDLNKVVIPMANQDMMTWGKYMGVFGAGYARVYGESGIGITKLRSDYETLPHFMRRWERAGSLVGWTNDRHVQYHGEGKARMLKPWKFVEFRMPGFIASSHREPFRINALPPNIDEDDFSQEVITEAQDYGRSHLEGAWAHWDALKDGLKAMRQSRAIASKKDVYAQVNVGDLSTEQAQMLKEFYEETLQQNREESSAKAKINGSAPTTNTTVLPVWGDGKGSADFNTQEYTPNITGLADIEMEVNLYCGAVGLEPSMLGFSSEMSGGLGEGGFLQNSIQAAMRASDYQQGILLGIQMLCRIHIAYKYNVEYPPGTEPWELRLNASNMALERERLETEATSVDRATAMVTLLQLINPQVKLPESVMKYIAVDQLEMPEAVAKELIEALTAAIDESDDSALFDSVSGKRADEEFIRDVVTNEFYKILEKEVSTNEND